MRLAPLVIAFGLLGWTSALAATLACPGSPPPLHFDDFSVQQPPTLAEPAPRIPFRDPVFGTCLVRVTDRLHDIAAGDASLGLKNEYSRVQSFNADETRLLVRGVSATWYLYDAATLQPIRRLPFDGALDPRWDASDPHRLYYSEDTRLMRCDVETGATSLVHDFAMDFPGQSLAWVSSRYEGSPSFDGRYWGFMAQDANWRPAAFLVYDLQTGLVTQRDLRGVIPADGEVDSVTLSPLGNYYLAYFGYCPQGQLGTDAQPCGLMVYDRNLQNGRGLLRIIGHSDTALDAQGREVVVYQDIDTDQISVLDLASGAVTPLWPIDFSHTSIGLHLSGRSSRLPGWALVSTHDSDTASHTWMDDGLFAIELKANGRILRIAHTHSLVDPNQEHDYWAEPQASVNRDFTRLVFTSNWNRSGTEQVEMYLAGLPAGWAGSLPLPGDVNSDGSVNALDVVAVINAVLGIQPLPAADVNGDKAVNALDVVFVINRVLRL